MKSIKFLGAVGMVTGSSYLLTDNNDKSILIDLGMFQGTSETEKHNKEKLEINATKIDAMILTHAHLDHCGRIPMLARLGFTGNIYCTAATRDLAEVVMFDSAKIAKKDHDANPLYDADDVIQILKQFKVVDYNHEFDAGTFKVTLRDAGHLLGSASLIIKSDKTIVFSGDLGNSPQALLKPTEFIDAADYVVMETTYGSRNHPREDSIGILQNEINQVEGLKGTLMIPAFSLNRTQDILHKIRELKEKSLIKKETVVFLDSAMWIEATEITLKHKKLFNDELAQFAQTKNPFDFPNLVITRRPNASRLIKKHKGAKVIVAGSGMMSGGRITGHAQRYLGDSNNRLLIVGYQAEETLGREIMEGAKTVKIYGEKVDIKASVTVIRGMSSHAGQTALLNWLTHIKGVKKLFLSHGEDSSRDAFEELVNDKLNISQISKPELNEEVVLK